MNSYSCCSPLSAESKLITTLSALLKIITQDCRLRLLCILRRGEHCVCELTGHVGLSQSLTSHHLRDLKDAGIVTYKKRGLKVYYSLTSQGKRITNHLFNIPQKEAKL